MSKLLISGDSNKCIEDFYASSLYITLKDHKCDEAIRMTVVSQTRMIRKAANSQGFTMGHVATSEGATYSLKPVQLYLTARLDGAT